MTNDPIVLRAGEWTATHTGPLTASQMRGRPCEFCDHGIAGGKPCQHPDCRNGIVYDEKQSED